MYGRVHITLWSGFSIILKNMFKFLWNVYKSITFQKLKLINYNWSRYIKYMDLIENKN